MTAAALAEQISCGPSPERHRETVERYLEAGFDPLILVYVGDNRDGFFEFFEKSLAPPLRHRAAA